jgi:hypothetical protein
MLAGRRIKAKFVAMFARDLVRGYNRDRVGAGSGPRQSDGPPMMPMMPMMPTMPTMTGNARPPAARQIPFDAKDMLSCRRASAPQVRLLEVADMFNLKIKPPLCTEMRLS